MALQHLRSSTASKRPDPAAMAEGQLALNTANASPGLFYKDATGALIKAGPVHIGGTAPNATPASGGHAGNSVGEAWLDTAGTNPLLKILDIKALSAAAHSVGSIVAVDNTFASSLLQQPLDLGADLSLLSTTKYTNGHSDSLGGAVCSNSDEWQEKMIFAQKAIGLQPSPFDAWLISRGAKTEAVRMERHCSNALELAKRLEERKGSKGRKSVRSVNYPFLTSHPQYKLAKKQMKAGGGMLLADFGLSYGDTLAFIRRLRLFTQAESLGGIESLVAHPASMTHASIPKETREAAGVTDGLVRFSVGIEHVEDLWEDIDRALSKK
jgi:cystathionine gamma-synthase